MGLKDFFTNLNSKMEKKYSAILDFFQDKGIPAYSYNDWLEKHGIPAMWFTIGIIVFIIILIVLLSYVIFAPNVTLTINLLEFESGTPIGSEVNLTIEKNGEVILSELVSHGDSYSIESLSIGDEISIFATLSGYNLRNSTYTITQPDEIITLSFEKESIRGSFSLKIVDSDALSPVAGAKVSLFSKDGELIGTSDSDNKGYASFDSADIGSDVSVTVEASGYAKYDSILSFSEGDSTDIELFATNIDSSKTSNVRFEVKSGVEFVTNGKVIIYNDSDEKIEELELGSEGIVTAKVKLGTLIRYVVSSEGFSTYDSNIQGTSKRIVNESDIIEVQLTQSSSKIDVTVTDGVKTLSGADVRLYTSYGRELAKEVSALGGVSFSGADIKNTEYVSVNVQGYYPQTKKVNLFTGGTGANVEFTMERYDMSSIANIEIFSVDYENSKIANASIKVYEDQNGKFVPLNVGDARTNLVGFLQLSMMPNKILKIDASQNNLKGSIEVLTQSGKNTAEIVMEPAGGFVNIRVEDAFSNPLKEATVRVKSKTGEFLFEEVTDEDGIVSGDTKGNKDVIVEVQDASGNSYSKVAQVDSDMVISFSSNDAIRAPTITLKGIYDGANREVQTVSLGEMYIFRFNVDWPQESSKGIIEFIAGDQGVESTAQNYGIVSVDSPNIVSSEYGVSYLEGNYSKDSRVLSSAGRLNKWSKVYYAEPTGTNEVSVVVKILDAPDLNEIGLSYRVYSEIDGEYFTSPKSNAKTEEEIFYSSAYTKVMSVLEESFECDDSICVSHKFIDDITTYTDFYPVQDQIYAIDFEVFSKNDESINLNLTTDEVTKTVHFNNLSKTIGEFKPQDREVYTLSDSIEVNANDPTKFRVYFTASQVGSSYITLTMIGSKRIDKKFNFDITPKVDMAVSIKSNGIIPAGEDISVKVTDAKGNVTDAHIRIEEYRNMNPAFYLAGDGTQDKGFNGIYTIPALPSKEYKMTIRAPGHITRVVNFVVSKIGVLSVPETVEIKIPEGSSGVNYSFDIRNLSTMGISNLRYDIIRDSSEIFEYRIGFPKPYIEPKSSSPLSVDLSSALRDERAFGDVDLMVIGDLESGESVRAITHLRFVNHENYDDSCLIVQPESLILKLPGFSGSKQTINFTFENTCEFDLVLTPTLVPRDESTGPDIRFNMNQIRIPKGEVASVDGTFTNGAEINADGQITDFFLNIDTSYFTKQMPINIEVWNIHTALGVSIVPHIFTQADTLAFTPMIIRNLGNVPIKNIELNATKDSRVLLNDVPLRSSLGIGENYNPHTSAPQEIYTYRQKFYDKLNSRPFQYPKPLGQTNQTLKDGDDIHILNPYLARLSSGLNYGGQDQYIGSINQGIFDFIFKPNSIPVIEAGASVPVQVGIYPRTQNSNTYSYYNVLAKGVLEGAQQNVEGAGVVGVISSSSKCLKLLNEGKTVSFRTSTLPKTLSQKLIFKNECLEPVVVATLDLDIAGNSLTLKPINSSSVIAPNERATFLLSIEGETPVNAVKSITLLAYSQNSRSAIRKVLPIEVNFGESAKDLLSTSDPIKRVEVKNCSTGERLDVIYPKVDNTDCSSGYCDGESSAKFLVKMASTYINDYKKELSTLGGKIDSTYCDIDSQSCAFENIGTEPMEFSMYMQNDIVSEIYVTKLISANKLGLAGVFGYRGDVDIEDNILAHKLFLPTGFEGCGKYDIKIEGATLVSSGVLQPDMYNIKISATKTSTDECRLEVYNAINFLPKDSSIGKDNAYNLMPGYISFRESNLEGLAEKLSTKLYGTQRIEEGKNNSLELKLGETNNNVPVEIAISESSGFYRVIATINNNSAIESEKTQKDITDYIYSFLVGDATACFDPDNKSASVEGISEKQEGAFTIISKDCSSISIFNGEGMSCSFSVETRSLNPNAVIDVVYPQNNAYGIEIYSGNNKISKGSKIKLDAQGSGRFAKELELKISVDNVSLAKSLSDSIAPKIVVKDPVTNSELATKNISFNPCGSDPIKFMTAVFKKYDKGGSYFAIPKWDSQRSETESYSICNMLKHIQKEKQLKDLPITVTASKLCDSDTGSTAQVRANIESDYELRAGLSALGAGVGGALVMGIANGFIKGPIGGVEAAVEGLFMGFGQFAKTAQEKYNSGDISWASRNIGGFANRMGVCSGGLLFDDTSTDDSECFGKIKFDSSKVNGTAGTIAGIDGSSLGFATTMISTTYRTKLLYGMDGFILKGDLKRLTNMLEEYIRREAKAGKNITDFSFKNVYKMASESDMETSMGKSIKDIITDQKELVDKRIAQNMKGFRTKDALGDLSDSLKLENVMNEDAFKRNIRDEYKRVTKIGEVTRIENDLEIEKKNLEDLELKKAEVEANYKPDIDKTKNEIRDIKTELAELQKSGFTDSDLSVKIEEINLDDAKSRLTKLEVELSKETKVFDDIIKESADKIKSLERSIKSKSTITKRTLGSKVASVANKSNWGGIVKNLGKGLIVGGAGAYATEMIYEGIDAMLEEEQIAEITVIDIQLPQGIENFVKYKPISMSYSGSGKNLILTLGKELVGENLTDKCAIDPDAIQDAPITSSPAKLEPRKAEPPTTKELPAATITKIDTVIKRLETAKIRNESIPQLVNNANAQKDNMQKVYNDGKSKKLRPLPFYYALFSYESEMKHTTSDKGAGIAQTTGRGCADIVDAYSENECKSETNKNLDSGMLIYEKNIMYAKTYLSAHKDDEFVVDFFAIYGYNRGSGTMQKAIKLWESGASIRDALKKSCELEYGTNSNFCNTGGSETYDYPINVLGIYYYITGRFNNTDDARTFIEDKMNSYYYSAPEGNLIWPSSYTPEHINSCIGYRGELDDVADASYYHEGTDIRAYRGYKVVAVANGKVIGSANNHVLIDHGEYYTYYMHIDPLVQTGSSILQGTTVGKTNNSVSQPHLHFEMLVDEEKVLNGGKNQDVGRKVYFDGDHAKSETLTINSMCFYNSVEYNKSSKSCKISPFEKWCNIYYKELDQSVLSALGYSNPTSTS